MTRKQILSALSPRVPIGQNNLHIYIYSLILGDVTLEIRKTVLRGLQGFSETPAPLSDFLDLTRIIKCKGPLRLCDSVIQIDTLRRKNKRDRMAIKM